MIDGKRLLTDLQPLLRRLQDDLLDRSGTDAELGDRLRDEWQRARTRERTAQSFQAWREDALAQAAVMWILACVFVRFLEDNDLVAPPRLAGPGERLRLARDQHTLYFQQNPLQSDREYLLSAFAAVAELPGAGQLFDRRHNPVWTTGISGDAAAAVLAFWQRVDPETGALVCDFTDSDWSTRFLGDLYQDLSESARKKYALLQTPDFVLQFILDRTLTPAIAEFGFREVTVIDPACGSGHFLLAAFERVFAQWVRHEPGTNPRELAQRALRQVSGVDLNPFAVAIARFRLLLVALRACGIYRLADAPAFEMELAAGDSLLHGPRPDGEGELQMYLDPAHDPISHVYETEDAEDLRRILGRRYHVVVGNPPYITPKDAALREAYRKRFSSCQGKYSLGVPFTERFFDLALGTWGEKGATAGHVGLITANSFMKREFGKELIEKHLPRINLTYVIDSSGVNIPGHNARGEGTTTVILVGRKRDPLGPDVRVIVGVRSELAEPSAPGSGPAWRSILENLETPGFENEWIAVRDIERSTLARHPWSLGRSIEAELLTSLNTSTTSTLADYVDAAGFAAFSGEDEVFIRPKGSFARCGVPRSWVRTVVKGEDIREWQVQTDAEGLCLYDEETLKPIELPDIRTANVLWPFRTHLRHTVGFGGQTKSQSGTAWWHWYRWLPERMMAPFPLIYAYIATHPQFARGAGREVFRGGASVGVVKLSAECSEQCYDDLLALLSSSVACFYARQVFYPKGGFSSGKWEERLEWDATKLKKIPVVCGVERALVTKMTALACSLKDHATHHILEPQAGQGVWRDALNAMVATQEEIDWQVYSLFGILDGEVPRLDAPPVQLGERAFEIVMARKMAAGELETTWFERHGSTPVTDIPLHWPKWYQAVVERRIQEIEANPHVALLEQPEHKRRWNVEPWDEQVQRAQRSWLLNRLESVEYWPEVAITSVARLADRARQDPGFMRVAALYRGQDTFDVGALVLQLVADEAVPHLLSQRHRPSGLRKREVWERTWALQRMEDAIDVRSGLPEGHPNRLSAEEAAALKQREVGDIPVPPKYKSTDFQKASYWKLRGKLDVPKERFISYPGCEREADPTLVISWAGWDHLQQARALATFYVQMKESEGWTAERLKPLLTGLQELLPWVKQWHNEVDPEFGLVMGDYFEGFVREEQRSLGVADGQGDVRHR